MGKACASEKLVREVSRSNVKHVILYGELIEDYPDDKPYPSALFPGFVDNRPLHVVAALDESRLKTYFVTVYEPSLDVWA